MEVFLERKKKEYLEMETRKGKRGKQSNLLSNGILIDIKRAGAREE